MLVNDDDLTYCALRLDPGSLTTLVDRIGDIAEPLPRTLCWSAAWEMTREAELKARDFIALVAGGFGAESEVGVVQRLLLQAQTTVTSYADEQWAAERGWPMLVDALRFRLDTAPAGSDAQLTVVNALTSSVLPAAVLDRMRGWLLDVAVPAGLTVDTDLRWRLLHALAAHGAAGEPEIDGRAAAATRPPTGQRQAERARALIPTAEAKERAWDRAVTDDEHPQRGPGSDHQRVQPPGPALAAGPVRGAVLRGGGRRVVAPHERAGAGRGGRAVPVVGGGQEHGGGGRRLAGRRVAPAGAAAAGVRGPGRDRAGVGGAGVRPVLSTAR